MVESCCERCAGVVEVGGGAAGSVIGTSAGGAATRDGGSWFAEGDGRTEEEEE